MQVSNDFCCLFINRNISMKDFTEYEYQTYGRVKKTMCGRVFDTNSFLDLVGGSVPVHGVCQKNKK